MATPEAICNQILALVKEYHMAKFTPEAFDPDKDLVHYAGRVFDAEEIVNLVDASLDFYLTANRYAERFEAEFADYLGLSNALLVNSGSSANLVALTALTSPKLKDRRLKPGDEGDPVGCVQLQKLDQFIARRKENFRKLTEMLKPCEDRLILPRATENADPSWFGYVVTVKDQAGFTRNDLTAFLETNRIETRNETFEFLPFLSLRGAE